MTSTNKIGFIQGRLSPVIQNKIQIFPVNFWKDEYRISNEIGLSLIEWTIDEDTFDENPLLSKEGISTIKKLNLENEIQIPSLTCDYLMQNPLWKMEGLQYEKIRDNFLKILESCNQIGIDIIVVPLVDNGKLENNWQEEKCLSFFEKISNSFINAEMRIAFESDYSPKNLKNFIDKFDLKIGINYDMGNSASLGHNPDEEILLLGSRILNIHIKDRLLNGTTVPLGMGNCNFIKIFKNLKKINYNKNYILQTARASDGNHKQTLLNYFKMTQEWLNV